MNVFGIGLPEMALIMVLALLVFGPKKLPEIGRSMGKAIRSFQEASKEFETEFKQEANQLNNANSSLEATLEPADPQALIPGAAQASPSEANPAPAVAHSSNQAADDPAA